MNHAICMSRVSLPLDRYPVRGVIWYQGESNAYNREAHERLFPLC